MATSTTNYSFTLPEVAGDTDQWGTQLNSNWTLADTTLKTIADSVGDAVTLTGNDYLTISGQAITVGDVDLTADVTGTLPVSSGGTGLSSLGTANQVLAVNSGGTALEFQTVSGSGTVTSIAVTGSDGIEIDSGSPITTSGTIALGINSITLSTHLGLGSLATQSSVTESQISDLGSYITASSTDTLTNKSGNISQWTNDSGYLTAETNNLSTVSGTLGIANGGTGQTTVATARVALLPSLATNGSKLVAVNSGATDIEYIATSTLNITESQITDLQSYLTAESNDLTSAVTWANVPNANITQGSVTQHQAALSITESQISDFGSYQTADAGLTSISGLTTAADKMIYTTASDTYAVADLTAAGRALLDDADAAAQRTTLGLGSLATQSSITESQISDLQSYLTAETNDLGSAVTGTLGTANGGTGLTAIGTAGQVLKVNSGATALEFADESGSGSVSYIEHSSTVSDSLAISVGTNRMYIGNTTFSGSGTMAGYLVISHGYANFTSASALNVTGTLRIVG